MPIRQRQTLDSLPVAPWSFLRPSASTADSTMGTLPPPSAISEPHSRRSSRSRAPSQRRQETDNSEKAGRVWAREVEDDPWAPCILTLDGGGIRGYSSLLILKALMHEIWKWEQRLDQEDGEEDVEIAMADSPTEERHEAGAGASRDDSNAKAETARDDSAADQLQLKKTKSAFDHVQDDQLASKTTKAKALLEDELLPCHYFDFMYGTSTGGIIATALGRLRMTVSEALDLYRTVGDTLFGKKRSSIPLMTKYHHQPLEKAVRDIVKKRCHEHADCDGNDWFPWDVDRLQEIDLHRIPFDVSEPRVCQSCCLTATHDQTMGVSTAHLLRSYPHYYSSDVPNWINRYNEGADRLRIWEVARATSAAPFYFDMLRAVIDDAEVAFKDGGIRENNPSGAALSEFHSLYEPLGFKEPAVMLSVGTGRPDMSQDGFAPTLPGILGRMPGLSKFLEKRAVIQNLLIKYTDGEKQHLHMREYAHGEHLWYKRLNVSDGLEDLMLDEWKSGTWNGQNKVPGGATLSRMEDATAKYLERDFDPSIDSYAPPSRMLRQMAEKLVRQRRAREQLGGLRWDTFVGQNLHEAPEHTNGTPG